MKSVLISFIMFAVIIAALHFNVFEVLSSRYAEAFGVICLLAALIFAFKKLGNPWSKDKDHE